MIRLTIFICALLLAACQATGIPETRSEPLPKGTALPPPEFDVEPGNEAAVDDPGR